jgi:hypothetical protein
MGPHLRSGALQATRRTRPGLCWGTFAAAAEETAHGARACDGLHAYTSHDQRSRAQAPHAGPLFRPASEHTLARQTSGALSA